MQLRNSQRGTRRDDNAITESLHQIWDRLCSRMGNLGTYRLMQINGQRKFFDPLDDSPPLVEGCEIFVGRIPRDMFEDELVPLFAHYGPIHELRLMMNFSGTNRGFAFVMYKQPQYAEEAIRKLNDFEVRENHFIGVIHSVNNRRLYIGRLHPSNANESNLLKLLSTLTEGLQSLSLHSMKRVADKPHRKYAIAVYVSHRHAAMARRFLILRKNEIFQEDVIVDWACPSIGLAKSDGSVHSSSSNENVSSFDAPGSLKEASSPNPDTQSPDVLSHSTPIQSNALPRFQKTGIFSPKVIVQFQEQGSVEEMKTVRPFQPFNRPPKNEKFIKSFNGNHKGLCYSRLTTPLYSLSPVPKPNSLDHLQPPPSVLTPREYPKVNAESSPPPHKGKPRPNQPNEKKVNAKKNRKAHGNVVPRFASGFHCGLAVPA